MALDTATFWQRTSQSGLFTPEQAARHQAAFAKAQPTATGDDAKLLAGWLVKQGLVSRWQAAMLFRGEVTSLVHGDYVVTDRRDQGPLSGLSQAVHRPTGHVVLLRFLSSKDAAQPEVLPAVEQCVARAATIDSDHVARCWQFLGDADRPLIVCEEPSGKLLEELLATGKRIPFRHACAIARDIALGLAAIHRRELLHGDVRPQTIHVASRGGATLQGYPLVGGAVRAALRAETLAGQVPRIGSPPTKSGVQAAGERADYQAPELIAPDAPLTVQLDLYALGMTLYRMLTGQLPWGTEPLGKRLAARLREEVPAADTVAPQVPSQVAQLVGYLLQRDPQQRYQHAEHVVEALAPYAADTTKAATTTAHAAYRTWLAQHAHVEQPVGVGASDAPWEFMNFADGEIESDAAGSPWEQWGGDDFDSEADNTSGLPFEISTSEQGSAASTDMATRTLYAGKKRRAWGPLALAAAVMLLVASIGFVMWQSLATPDLSASAPTDRPRQAANDAAAPPRDAAGNSFLGPAVWESPTDGAPLSVAYLPPGVQTIFWLAPAQLAAHPEGAKIVSALGPWFTPIQQMTQTVTDGDWSGVERLTLGLLDNAGQAARQAWLWELTEPLDPATAQARWNAEEVKVGDQTIYRTPQYDYWLPPSGEGRLVVAATPEDLTAILEQQGAPPVLQREMEELLARTDDQRFFTALFAPAFLTAGGKVLLDEERQPLLEQLPWFFGPAARAGLLSLHLDQDLFVDLQVYGSSDQPPARTAAGLQSRLGEIPQQVASHLGKLVLSPYSQPILARYPAMLSALVNYSRFDLRGRETVIHCYLPAEAAHNLLLGTRLALLETPELPWELADQPESEPGETRSIAERLAAPLSLSFPRSTLVGALELLTELSGIRLDVASGDLELEGITRNQSFGLEAENSTAREVLHSILQKASPEGKLVYVERTEAGVPYLLITTRTAAARRGDTLPDELMESPPANPASTP